MPRIFANDVDEEANFSDDRTTSRDNSESKGTLKKGPWTADEDAILTEYVKKHGEGNWNSVQKNCGLARCGKSCRLRWTNHLRPNLKKGAISEEEEKIIIELHAKLGNKWARMAAQLPGRTDNEIKNFWNTRMKRRQRAGLPLYPPGVQDEFAVNDNLQIQHDQSNSNPSPSAFSLSSLISSAYHPNLTNPLHNMNQSDSASAYYTKTVHQFNENSAKGNMVLPLFPVSPYGPSYLMPFAHSFSATGSHGFHSEAFPMVHGGKTEVSWSKTTGSETPASSNTSGFDGLMGASSVVNDCYVVAPPANCGLLDALVVEAQTLSHSEKSNSGNSVTVEDLFVKEQGLAADDLGEEEDNKPVDSSVKDFGDTTTKIQKDDLNSSRSLTGKKRAAEYPMEEMNPMDDDLFCLLNNFPVEMPTPEWYRRGERQSLGLESPKYTLNTEHEELAWTLGTRWKNLPGIS